ncbi:hypothetical protein AAVH_40799, partial [Aphelenchoides avenae]
MSKLFLAVLAFSSVSLAVGHEDLSLGFFVNNPKIKLLSNPAALAALRLEEPNGYRAVEQVKEVLKEHAPTLYLRVEKAKVAFENVIHSLPASKSTDFLNQ